MAGRCRKPCTLTIMTPGRVCQTSLRPTSQPMPVSPAMTDVIPIILNGEPQNAPPGETITELLSRLHLDPQRVAVELDRELLRRDRWADTVLEPGAQLEIVQFVGGG